MFGIEAKTTFTSIMVVVNPLVWYYLVISVLKQTLTKMPVDPSASFFIWGAHFSGIICSALVGAILVKRIGNTRFLKVWMILGVMASLFLGAINSSSLLIISLLAFLLGASLGIGMPACMEYYTRCVPVEKRGRVSGIIMLTFVIGMALFNIVGVTDPLTLGIVLAAWRFASLLPFLLLRPAVNRIEQKKGAASYKQIFNQKSFVLYFIPWVMFSLVNYLTSPVQSSLVGEQIIASFMLIQNGFMGISAVVGGFLLDYIGRKRIAIAGFVMIGLSAAVFGVYPGNLLSVYFSAIVGGIAWGFIFVLFILTIWGDLSHGMPSDTYYALGVTPFFISYFLEFTVGKYISALVPASALFSFTVLFLFLAVLPLVYAPETLPEKTLKDRDLKSYTEKALKQAQKDAEKSQKKSNNKKEHDDSESEAEENPEGYDEARKLAEKYY